MNLAEFPFASLRNRPDSRTSLVYDGYTVTDAGRLHQRWIVRGLSDLGLPTEYDERVYVALMVVTAAQGFASQKVTFSIYQLLKIMDVGCSKRSYQQVERALDRLVGVTFKSEGAFWDERRQERIRSARAFHLIEEYWLRYREPDDGVREAEGVPAYVVWSNEIWSNLQQGYIKRLDSDFFYSLENATSRRLYRFLDKRMWYQKEYEIDIFDLTARLGMARYDKPSHAKRKLMPAFNELTERGFLSSARTVRRQGYTRCRFEKPDDTTTEQPVDTATLVHGQRPSLSEKLMEYGIRAKKAASLVAEYESERINEKLELLEWKVNPHTRTPGRPIEDAAGWLIRAIERDYALPDGFKTSVQRAEEQAEREALWQQVEERRKGERARSERRREEIVAYLRDEYGTGKNEDEAWEHVLTQLEQRLPSESYRLWLSGTMLLSLTADAAIIGVPHKTAADFVTLRLEELICEALGGRQRTLRCEVIGEGNSHDAE